MNTDYIEDQTISTGKVEDTEKDMLNQDGIKTSILIEFQQMKLFLAKYLWEALSLL